MAPDDPLALDAETMRRLGYRTVDALVDLVRDDGAPPLRRATPAEMAARLPHGDPELPTPFDDLLRRLTEDVLPFASRGDHPGFLAFIPFAGTWPGALGDFAASAANVYAGSWMESAGPSHVELEVLDWFRSWIGYPESAAGVLVSGGSAANMTALACARETLVGPMADHLVAYVSDQSHASLARNARVLGFRPAQVRVLPTGADFRLRPETLASAMDADLRVGRKPLFASASAGATNTGAVDPIAELAAVCRQRGAWLHADAAYGGFAVLAPRGRDALAGIAEADSITLDPHKWLYQPYECGCLLVRHGERLRRAFAMEPDYLVDAATAPGEVNFADLGLQLTRSTRALKVWVSVRSFGLAAFRAAIERSLDVAAAAAARIERSPALELLAPPSLGIVCFRRRFPGVDSEQELERRNRALVATLEASGAGLVSTTRLRGRLALRACVLGHATDTAAVDRVLDVLERSEVPDDRPLQRRAAVREPRIEETWPARPCVPVATLGDIPLLASLDEDAARFVATTGRVRDAAPGETIVAQWETGRELYVILDGEVEVRVDDRPVGRWGRGEFFGELAALEWGSGYAYPRLATVTATAPTRLLALDADTTNRLVREHDEVARLLRESARERLRRLPA